MVGRRASRRRRRAQRAVRRRPHGPDLRQPGGTRRRSQSEPRRRVHPPDLHAHGHERRGNRRPDRRRSHFRQGPRRGAGESRRRRPRRREYRASGHRLGQQPRLRHGRRHDHQRHRGRLDRHADDLGQQIPRKPLPARVGADHQPGRQASVPADQCGVGGDRAGRPRPRHPPRTDDAHHRPRHARGSGLRGDHEAASSNSPPNSKTPSPAPGSS